METLNSIKSDIDQHMRQSQTENVDYVDYEDSPRYAYKRFHDRAKRVFLNQFKSEGRGNNSNDESNLVSINNYYYDTQKENKSIILYKLQCAQGYERYAAACNFNGRNELQHCIFCSYFRQKAGRPS